MSFELLFDPLFRVPFATGLLLAAILPLIGMYLRLRNEWLAALAFAQMASAGALVAMVLDGPMLAGGVLAALLAALVKGLLARAGASAYALMMLLAWGGGVLLVANHPLAEQAGHALFDGQLYFTGEAHLLVTALAAVVVLPVLPGCRGRCCWRVFSGVLPGAGAERAAPAAALRSARRAGGGAGDGQPRGDGGLCAGLRAAALRLALRQGLEIRAGAGRAGRNGRLQRGVCPLPRARSALRAGMRFASRYAHCGDGCEIRQDVNHVARALECYPI
jgi:hypothetical protein